MSSVIIDRRKNDKHKSISNRQKFVKRVNKHVKNLIKKTIQEGKISDIDSASGKKVSVPAKNLKQPEFHYDYSTGKREGVLPGNKEYVAGDWIYRPEDEDQGNGQSCSSPGQGDGEDSFEFVITSKEYQDLFFADLELPDLVKKAFEKLSEKVYKRDGYQLDGPAGRLNYLQTLKQSIGRRVALRNPRQRVIQEIEQKLNQINIEIITTPLNTEVSLSLSLQQAQLIEELERAKNRLKSVPFIDDVDLRYNRFEEEDVPITQAVMFCIMDVSGSMGEWEKEMAKRFFMILYLFLHRSYQNVDVVFIRHTEHAEEVDEETFFYSTESGGTEIMPAMKLTMNIIKDRYPLNAWNVYCCQASDGDVFAVDAQRVVDTLSNKLLKLVQYFAYIEIGENPGQLSLHYKSGIGKKFTNFDQTRITNVADIFPVFRKLFEKKLANEKK